jgi:uridine phosphorylase
MADDYPILEFDPEREALIEPSRFARPVDGMPEPCLLVFFSKLIEQLRAEGRLSPIAEIGSSMGPMPVYLLEHAGTRLALVHPGLGAPLAAAVLEELLARGCRRFVACGSAGVLDGGLDRGAVVVPEAAVRDEGTSYHYLPPTREVRADPDVVAVLEQVLQAHGTSYRVGKTWTTDAIFRETRDRIRRRRAEGCLTVEMECSALLAVARFRGVRLGQLLLASDDVSGAQWDRRRAAALSCSPHRLLELSAEACLNL